jgi:MtN3 and saliva related transmembrane protein
MGPLSLNVKAKTFFWHGKVSLERVSSAELGFALRTTTMDLSNVVGVAAAVGTTVSYFPQVRKAWMTRSVGDLSLRTVLLLSIGLGMWVLYGWLERDGVILIANSISLVLALNLVLLKLGSKRNDPTE